MVPLYSVTNKSRQGKTVFHIPTKECISLIFWK